MPIDLNEGYDRARELLRACSTDDGFVASPTIRDNYRRVWARDGVLAGLAALADGDEKLIDTFRATLQTLADYRGPHSEIPSNVDTIGKHVSYGMSTGRVDAGLWFVIGCGAYWRHTKSTAFLKSFLPCLRKVRALLGAWEFNARGLLYVPQTGDWSDEYIQQGYVLYDELLYWRALNELAGMERAAGSSGKKADQLLKDGGRLGSLILSNYWFGSSDHEPKDIYHPTMYQRGREAASCKNDHWMPYFSPKGYGSHFDALANVLASLLGLADVTHTQTVDRCIDERYADKQTGLLPAFSPVVMPGDPGWQDLHAAYSFSFKNEPYAFHNGGLWVFITALHAADLALRGKKADAQRYLSAAHAANALDVEGDGWGFYEFIHGKTHVPGGTRLQCWSAAGVIIAEQALRGRSIF